MAALVKGIPVLPVEDMSATLSFYKDKLGFSEQFRDNNDAPGYVGLKRDDVELHLTNVGNGLARTVAEQTMVRFEVKDVDALYGEYEKHDGVIHPNGKLNSKPWGTREFGVLDPSGVCLTFFHDA
ncbi:MAG: VOC family protein [Planctomycetes bacterium]|nr:VOC family protein [Planctomycetota bacterium]MCA8945169.1 VOC family protein [Planctomycetota bacterium]